MNLDIIFQYVIPTLTLVVVLWDKVRSLLLSAYLDEENFDVPRDEVKESFRRNALAEVSKKSGGRRVELELEWHGYTLIITTKKQELTEKQKV